MSTKKIKTMEEYWEQFSAAVFRGKDIGETQRRETRKAFFAGALCTMDVVGNVSDSIEDIDAGAQALEDLHQEVIRECERQVVDDVIRAARELVARKAGTKTTSHN